VAARVYSTVFYSAHAAPLSFTYTVPAGQVAIVRDIDALFEGNPGNTALSVYDPGTLGTVYYHLQTNPNEYVQWRGRQVFLAGQRFTVASAGPNAVGCRVSGYLLTES
jgi:hypothetical protein